VFTDNVVAYSQTPGAYAALIAHYVADETGHLLGFEHAFATADDGDEGGALDALAFKPDTPIVARPWFRRGRGDGRPEGSVLWRARSGVASVTPRWTGPGNRVALGRPARRSGVSSRIPFTVRSRR
jgi:hypothetical protein